ncbi:hypothetical protein SEA_ILEEKAY_35 [Mycobacterium phage ILeeKay]|uniref:hypothetical protein n=1 Tax=Mycobacterium phage Papez TaxID=1873891 RepID=UPI00080EECA7|nr:hypothetical protein PBI_PAPEZ_35 [Mycobacterium phage Papez]ANT42003.1 hypothetical protein PBI_PAPEZ_35 [Mycobacterium phage Papez]ATN89374.1 hypothetical protein SEA_ILEEKAY_35 [Mycobacterium phage ILeeKay]
MSDLYSAARVEAAKAQFNWLTDDFKLAFIDADEYTVNYATDQVLEDIPTAAVIAISESLDTKSVSASGWMKAGTTVFVEPEGNIGEAVVLFKDTGDPATSTLVAYLDSEEYQQIIPNGADVYVLWHADGIIQF